MSTTLTAKLVCPECRRENEPERIYCHDCGARLDRSALARMAPKEPDPKATQRRLKNMFDPRRAKLRNAFFNVSKLALGALLVAGVVQMLRPPELPAMKEHSAELAPQINLDLSNAAMDPRVAALRYSDEQVNTYLASVLKSRKASMFSYAPADQIAVAFKEGVSNVIVRRSLFGYPIYTSVILTPNVNGEQLVGKADGGAIGRLPIHPLLMQYADLIFGDVRKALGREEKAIAKVGAVEVHPQQIVIARRAPQA